MATRTPRPAPLSDDDAWAAVPAGSAPVAQADEHETQQSPIERVMVALSETADPNARSRLMLYRVIPGALGRPERVEYCEDMMPSEFEAQGLSGIRDVWGPGTYEARLMGHKMGSPHFVRLAAPRFTLAPMPTHGSSPRLLESPSAGIEAALRALADSQARMLEALTAQRSAPPVDPVQQMQQTLGLMTAMREAMGLTQQSPVTQPQKSTIGEIVDAIKELKEVSTLVNPDSQPEKTDMEKIMEMAGPVVSMIQQSLTQRQSSQPAQPVLPQQMQPLPQVSLPAQFDVTPEQVSAPQVAESATPQTQSHQETESLSEGDQAVLDELKSYLAQLVLMAEKGESTEKGAELVYDKLPDDWIELIHTPIWWEALKTIAPQVEMHETWVRAVRDRVVAMFAEDEIDVANQQVAVKGA